jgi:hypothetical protein
MIRVFSLLALLFFAAPVAAKDLILGIPIDCTLGKTCYIQQYVDRDPGPGVTDFSCGVLSYDGHKGTDFALPSLAKMQAGVNVLAAASGVITATRNNMLDIMHGDHGAPDITGKECGNGLVIKHDGGWETQYCHLKRGSVIVEKGQKVNKGDVLGQVGLSGKTQFPHVHLSVRKNGAVIDPFDADQTLSCNDTNMPDLWKTDIAYVGSGIIRLGFDNKVPEYADIKAGTAGLEPIRSGAPALVLWAYAFGSEPGSLMRLEFNGPKGQIIRQEIQLERQQALFFRAAGKRRKTAEWPAGIYTGTATLLRDGVVTSQRETSIEIR